MGNSNNTYNAEICATGILMSKDHWLIFALCVKVVLCILGVVILPIVLIKEKLSALFHRNARCIFRCHICFVIVGAFGTVVNDGLDLLRMTAFKWWSSNATCPVFPMSSNVAVPLRLIKIFGMSGIVHAFVACVLERIYATLIAQTYEWVNDKIGVILSVMTVLTTAGCCLVIGLFSDKNMLMPMTVIPPSGLKYSLMVLYVDGYLELFIVIVFGVLWTLNYCRGRTNNHIQNSLSFKFQTQENVAATSLFFPLAVLHAIFQISTSVIMPLFLFAETDQVKRTRLVGLLELGPFYNFALPVVMLWRIRAKQRKIDRLMASNLIGKFSTGRSDADKLKRKHFEMLENMFK
ncbi:hypothetical protein L596_027026 [Steinernema carpocapsae]|uniref:G-protein coupled receptors family 1 profile domain-containing protein n=1 Tax=Steinernema carpocapsae TaxID=34508 RepID=A0A4U5M337_STECR|nr:hypothetical protein L596_027026 [Steinernema carpocapsae]